MILTRDPNLTEMPLQESFVTRDHAENVSSFLGAWSSDESALQHLRQQFMSASPFPYVTIEEFFAPEVAARIESRFPTPCGRGAPEWITQGWHVGGL
jgi:hypothetical protein